MNQETDVLQRLNEGTNIISYISPPLNSKIVEIFYNNENNTHGILLINPDDFDIKDKGQILSTYYQAGGITDITEILFKRDFSWDKLSEIRRVLLSGEMKTALIAALTLPEICSKIEYENEINNNKDGRLYKKWFNENVYKFEIGEHGKKSENFDCFNGAMCYALRCRLMHGDKNNIEDMVNNQKSSFKYLNNYKKVIFRFHDKLYSEFFTIINNKNEKFAIIFHSLPQLILSILCCADKLYIQTENKDMFYDGCDICYAIPYKTSDINNWIFTKKQSRDTL